MNEDVASFYTHLKETTAQLLGYADADNLTAAQQIRLERAISLRLICDDTAARQMRGQPIDVKAFTDGSKDLERMVGGEPEQTTGPDHNAAVLEIEASINGILRARAQADAARDADLLRREEMAAIAAAGVDVGLAAVSPAAADGRAQGGDVPHPSLSAAPANPPPQRETNLEKMARVNSSGPPDRYLKQPVEEWRRHIDASGEIIAPYWRGGYG